MITIGITGVLGSGKTTVAGVLKEFGIPVVDADEISRNVTRAGTPVFGQIVDVFGDGVVGASGELDRKKLASIVFADASRRRQLEAIIHPAVQDERERRLAEIGRGDPGALVAVDIPLLFEAGLEHTVDHVICAYADEDTLRERVRKRDGMTDNEISARLKNQLPIDEKARRSGFVVDTRVDMNTLRRQLRAVIEQIAPHFFRR